MSAIRRGTVRFRCRVRAAACLRLVVLRPLASSDETTQTFESGQTNIHGANRSTTVALRVCASLGSARRPPAGDAGSGRVAMDLELRVVAFRVLFFTVVPFLILLSAGVLEVPEEHVTAVSNVLVSVPLPRKILRATRSSSTALSPALPSPPPAPSLPPGNDTRPSADVAASTPTVEETVPYCVIQIGNAGDIAEREASRFDPTPHPGASHHMYVNPGSITASTTFDALFAGRAGGCREDAEWYFVGDDDTLFFHRSIVRFATQRRRQVTMKVAHGNEFNPTLAKKGWFTGGSGVALSRGMAEAAETRRAASEFRDVLAAEFKWCNCFDVPFMRGLEWVGMRPFHAPNLFLDSCLDCDEGRRLVEDTPVVGCHGATIFREENPHPKNKNGDPYAETKQSLSYRQIQAFRSMGFEDRRTYFESACERTRR